MKFFQRRKKAAAAATPAPSPASPLQIANLQGQGARCEQQDAFGLSRLSDYPEAGLLAVLADGMGGMAAGKAIAECTVAALLGDGPAPDAEWVARIEAQSRALYADYRGSGGCTLLLAYLLQNRLWFYSVGDSDLFLLRNGELTRMNRLHTFRNELYGRALQKECSIKTPEEHPQAAALSMYMGSADFVCDHTRRPFPLQAGDALLLCSDGVSGTLREAQLASALALPPEACARALEDAILRAQRPEQDNYTAIIIRYQP